MDDASALRLQVLVLLARCFPGPESDALIETMFDDPVLLAAEALAAHADRRIRLSREQLVQMDRDLLTLPIAV